MSLQEIYAELNCQFKRMDDEQLKEYISALEKQNRSLEGFIHSPILTANTMPIAKQIDLNNLLISRCKKILSEKREDEVLV